MSHQPILVVEDSAEHRQLLEVVFHHEGFAAKFAGDALEAGHLLRSWHPHLILVDIVLPREDGLSLTRRLRADSAFAGSYIVALTARAMDREANQARLAGCDGYITKPIDPRTLGQLVRSLLESSRNPWPFFVHRGDLTQTEWKVSVLIVDDDEEYRSVLKLYLEDRGYNVLEAADGKEALSVLARTLVGLMIVDLVMPGAEGLETITKLRLGRFQTKILAVSGDRHANVYLQMARLLGADATVPKGGPISDILNCTDRLCSGS